jgi:HAD superfamily hydrolase (TIGR01509 family)
MAEAAGALAGLRPSAVVFDCDGLLLDTEPCWTVAETAVFGRRGLPYGPAEKARFIGRSVPGTAELMASIFDEVGNEDAILAELLDLIGDVIKAEAEPMPGAVELVGALSGRMPVAVASNSPRSVLDAALRRGGLDGAFAAVVAADEVAEPKPAPDLYLGACRLLGVDPAAAVAFEDTGTGAASARAAGLMVVGVPSPEAGDFGADLVFSSLANPALRAWAASL